MKSYTLIVFTFINILLITNYKMSKHNRLVWHALGISLILSATFLRASAIICGKNDLDYGFSECDRLANTRTGKDILLRLKLFIQ